MVAHAGELEHSFDQLNGYINNAVAWLIFRCVSWEGELYIRVNMHDTAGVDEPGYSTSLGRPGRPAVHALQRGLQDCGEGLSEVQKAEDEEGRRLATVHAHPF